MIAPTPTAFDFERDMMPPDWLVAGVIERGTVTVLSGDTSAGKSLLANALAVAVIRGDDWLGRPAQPGRALIADEENHRRLVRDRLRALGLTNADRDALRYFVRSGVSLGEPDWDAWLVRQVREHRADLVVIDTASSATSGDVNDNSKVAALYRNALRPAAHGGAAVILLHHERKTNGSFPRNASQSMMGARQWAGQADAHIAIRATGKLASEPLEGGRSHQRFPIEMETPKVRDGQPALPQRLAITSERDADGRLEWLTVEREGESVDPAPSGTDRLLPRIVEAIDGRDAVARAEIAKAVGLGSKDGRLQRALDEGLSRGLLTKPQRGQFGVR